MDVTLLYFEDCPSWRAASAHLETLAEAYNHFFFHYDDAPLLIVNTNEIDLVSSDADYEGLLGMIREHTNGTRYIGGR